jgi:hypothetical protein
MREPPVKAKEGIYTCQELSHLGLSGRRKAKKRGPLANIQQWHPSQQRAAFQAIAITTPR